MRASRAILVLALVLLVASPVLAKKEKKAQPKPRPCPVAMQVEKAVEGLTLTDAQKATLDGLKKEYAPKVADAAKKIDGILSPDQKKARGEAMKAAKAANKSKEEAAKAVDEAMRLTEEQKTKMADARKEMQALNKELREKIIAVLTPDQKDQIKKAQKAKKQAAK